jgi:hypothetical protein
MEDFEDEMEGLKENRTELVRLLTKESDPTRKKRIQKKLLEIDAKIEVLKDTDAHRT